MTEEQVKHWLWPASAALGAAVIIGSGLGGLSRLADWGFSLLVLPVGLAAGLAVMAFRDLKLAEQAILGVLAAAVGIGIFAWVSATPSWRAETDVANDELDDLCIRVTALQICHERKIMGVFDFSDVPESICREAEQRVEEMDASQKMRICDKTFGERINAGSVRGLGGDSMTLKCIWVVLALALSMLPVFVRYRWFES